MADSNIIGINGNVLFNTVGQPFYCVPSTGTIPVVFNPTGISPDIRMEPIITHWTTSRSANVIKPTYTVYASDTNYLSVDSKMPSQIQIGHTEDKELYYKWVAMKQVNSTIAFAKQFKDLPAEYALTGSRYVSAGITYSGAGYWTNGSSSATSAINNVTITNNNYSLLRLSGTFTMEHHMSGYPYYVPSAKLDIPQSAIVSGSNIVTNWSARTSIIPYKHIGTFDVIVSGIAAPFKLLAGNTNVIDTRMTNTAADPENSGTWDFDPELCKYKLFIE